MRNLLPPSCCKVLVINGAFGDLRYGLSSTLRTSSVAPCRPAESSWARASLITTTASLAMPFSLKSLPVAMRTPSTDCSVAVNCGEVAVTASISQYAAEMWAMRSCSRSTTKRMEGLCTRPADKPRLTLRHKIGETEYPYKRSRMRRASAASTSL